MIKADNVETGHSENVVAAWFKRKPVMLEEAKRSSLCVSELVGDNIALFSEEGSDSIKFGCHRA